MLLAAGNGHTACCELLINEGADIQQCGIMKDTPLSRAAHNGHFQTCKFLLEQGAEVDAMDLGDNTPLHWASMRGHVEIVNLLLMHGADRHHKNKQERMPIDLCQPIWSNAWSTRRRCCRSERAIERGKCSDVVFFIPLPFALCRFQYFRFKPLDVFVPLNSLSISTQGL